MWSGSLYQEKRRHLFRAVKTVWALTCRTFPGHQEGVTSVTQEGHIPINPKAPGGHQRNVNRLSDESQFSLDYTNQNTQTFIIIR